MCDHNLKFIDCVVGWPGSVHDARVLGKSSLYETSTAGENCGHYFHLLGNSAYPLKEWLLTPFKERGNLGDDQAKYNYVHSSTRMATDRAFGMLKGRFTIQKFVRWSRIEDICIWTLVMTAVVFFTTYVFYMRKM